MADAGALRIGTPTFNRRRFPPETDLARRHERHRVRLWIYPVGSLLRPVNEVLSRRLERSRDGY